MLRAFIIFLFMTGLIGCKEHIRQRTFLPVLSDTSTNKRNEGFDIALKDLTQRLHVPLLNNGVDSFEYRFWFAVDYNLMNFIRIYYDNSSWKISEILVWSHIPPYEFNKHDTINHLLETVIDSTKTRFLLPVNGMEDFIDSLQSYKLEQAPPSLMIENSIPLAMDGFSHTIEIAGKSNYRRIIYNCPAHPIGLHKFHESIKQLFYFLEGDLNIKFAFCRLISDNDVDTSSIERLPIDLAKLRDSQPGY